MARNASAVDVQAAPPRLPGARRVHTLPLDALRPVIRIAHRSAGALRIPERIIVDHEFVLVTRGRGEFAIDGERFDYQPLDLFLLPPFVPHRIEGGEGVDSEHLAVHFDLSPSVPGADESPRDRLPYEVQFPRGLALPRRMRMTEGDANVKRLHDVVALRERGDELAEIEAVARLTLLVVSLLGEQASPRSIDPRNRVRLERAVAWLRDNLHREIGVDDLADAAGLSPSHLRRLFRQWTGYGPNEYVRRARVDRARQLLGDVDLTLKQIAARCGFKDPFHFSKVFRAVDGLPPSRYREALLAGRVDERI